MPDGDDQCIVAVRGHFDHLPGARRMGQQEPDQRPAVSGNGQHQRIVTFFIERLCLPLRRRMRKQQLGNTGLTLHRRIHQRVLALSIAGKRLCGAGGRGKQHGGNRYVAVHRHRHQRVPSAWRHHDSQCHRGRMPEQRPHELDIAAHARKEQGIHAQARLGADQRRRVRRHVQQTFDSDRHLALHRDMQHRFAMMVVARQQWTQRRHGQQSRRGPVVAGRQVVEQQRRRTGLPVRRLRCQGEQVLLEPLQVSRAADGRLRMPGRSGGDLDRASLGNDVAGAGVHDQEAAADAWANRIEAERAQRAKAPHLCGAVEERCACPGRDRQPDRDDRSRRDRHRGGCDRSMRVTGEGSMIGKGLHASNLSFGWIK